jgi:tetratricopeptide (TPR) repeat protein
MLTIIALILLSVSVLVMLSIIIGKFPALAILNVDNLPGKKESEFKDRIIKSRVERDVANLIGNISRVWLEFRRRLSGILKRHQEQLKKAKNLHRLEEKLPWLEKQRRLKVLLLEAEDSLKKEDEEAAEAKLVEAASLDQRNLRSFFLLGEIYTNQKKFAEARQTFDYALKLSLQADKENESPEITAQEILFSWSQAEKSAGDNAAALEKLREALDHEANNPRYLDLIIDLSIMEKDKRSAELYWQKLAAVNPENNKLGAWREEIDNLEAPL